MKEKLFFFSLYTCICQFCCYRIFVNRITFHFEATVLFFFSSSFSSLALLFWYGMDDESYRQNVNIMTDKRWIWYLLLRYRRGMGIGVECFANLFDKNKKLQKERIEVMKNYSSSYMKVRKICSEKLFIYSYVSHLYEMNISK